jgi:hypothetical protein
VCGRRDAGGVLRSPTRPRAAAGIGEVRILARNGTAAEAVEMLEQMALEDDPFVYGYRFIQPQS